jgi:hypothetical protein
VSTKFKERNREIQAWDLGGYRESHKYLYIASPIYFFFFNYIF